MDPLNRRSRSSQQPPSGTPGGESEDRRTSSRQPGASHQSQPTNDPRRQARIPATDYRDYQPTQYATGISPAAGYLDPRYVQAAQPGTLPPAASHPTQGFIPADQPHRVHPAAGYSIPAHGQAAPPGVQHGMPPAADHPDSRYTPDYPDLSRLQVGQGRGSRPPMYHSPAALYFAQVVQQRVEASVPLHTIPAPPAQVSMPQSQAQYVHSMHPSPLNNPPPSNPPPSNPPPSNPHPNNPPSNLSRQRTHSAYSGAQYYPSPGIGDIPTSAPHGHTQGIGSQQPLGPPASTALPISRTQSDYYGTTYTGLEPRTITATRPLPSHGLEGTAPEARASDMRRSHSQADGTSQQAQGYASTGSRYSRTAAQPQIVVQPPLADLAAGMQQISVHASYGYPVGTETLLPSGSSGSVPQPESPPQSRPAMPPACHYTHRPPWISSPDQGVPPAPPGRRQDLWTNNFPIGNIVLVSVEDPRYGPASQSVSRTNTDSADQSRADSSAAGISTNQRSETSSRSLVAASSVATASSTEGGTPKQPGKDRPGFVTWQLHERAAFYVAPLLTSLQDPRKVRQRRERRLKRGKTVEGSKLMQDVIGSDLRAFKTRHHREWWLPVKWEVHPDAPDKMLRVPPYPVHPCDGQGHGNQPLVLVHCYASHPDHPYTISYIWAGDPGGFVYYADEKDKFEGRRREMRVRKEDRLRTLDLGEARPVDQYCRLSNRGYNTLRSKWDEFWYSKNAALRTDVEDLHLHISNPIPPRAV